MEYKKGEIALRREDIEKVAEEIESYLLSNPNAADSLHGITNWWIAKQRITENISLVENAVEYLIELGVICKNEIKNENKRRHDDIQQEKEFQENTELKAMDTNVVDSNGLDLKVKKNEVIYSLKKIRNPGQLN